MTALSRPWSWEPLVAVPLLLSGVVYVAGLVRLWGQAGVGGGVRRWQALSFAGGWLVLVVALDSPIASASDMLFSVHMTQHMLLMLVAAPLLVFGHPLLVSLWAFNGRQRIRLTRAVRGRAMRRVWPWITAPVAVFLTHAAVLWLWHVPLFYDTALRHAPVHAFEHLTMVAAAALFWWGMVYGRYGRQGYGVAVLYVFLTAIHSAVLGALLTTSSTAWYPDYRQQATAWHVNALADQQLGGLIMWVPAGVVFVLLGLALFAAWLGESERRAQLT